MKKLVLVAALLIGGAAASQAGVSINIGFGLPFPRPERVIIGRPAPVIVAQPVCAKPAPIVVAPPVCAPTPVVVVPPSNCEPPRYGHYDHRWDRRDWNRHDRDDRRHWDHPRHGNDRHGHGHPGHGGHDRYRRH